MSVATGIDIRNLPECILDIRRALQSGPRYDSTFSRYLSDFPLLISDLRRAAQDMPYSYQRDCVFPLLHILAQLGGNGLNQLFFRLDQSEGTNRMKRIIADTCLAVLSPNQLARSRDGEARNALQELSDCLFDELFVSSSSPLVKLGSQATPRFTRMAAAALIGSHTPILDFPVIFSRSGLITWTTLGHEVIHHLSDASPNVIQELKERVREAVYSQFRSMALTNYWADRIEESLADVYSVLSMGPTAALSYLAFTQVIPRRQIEVLTELQDRHPVYLLRGFMMARVVSRLVFSQAATWARLIDAEFQKDLVGRTIGLVDEQTGISIPFPANSEGAIRSTYLVADVLAHTRLHALNGRSMSEISNWTDGDQQMSDLMSRVLSAGNQALYVKPTHIIAGLVQASLRQGADLQRISQAAISSLAAIHQRRMDSYRQNQRFDQPTYYGGSLCHHQ